MMLRVSLCVVAYNEEKYLPSLLKDIENQTYSHEYIEVVLIDSASTDNTKKIMEDFKRLNTTFYSVVVADNPKRVQAAGWNVAIKESTCEVLIRLDAHMQVPKDFTTKTMNNISDGEYVAGGCCPSVIENNTKWAQLLLNAENSLFGSSVGASRHSQKKMYIKTLSHAAYRKEIFKQCGGFNEKLLRTEDNEMHYRIRQAGYKLCYDPQIVSYQFARSSLVKNIKQKYGNGYWIGLTLGVCPGCISLYHLIPFAFVLGVIFTSLLALCGIWQLAALMWTLYVLFAVTNTALSIKNDGFNPYSVLMPIVFLCLHTGYGLGTLVGVSKIPFKRESLKYDTKSEL